MPEIKIDESALKQKIDGIEARKRVASRMAAIYLGISAFVGLGAGIDQASINEHRQNALDRGQTTEEAEAGTDAIEGIRNVAAAVAVGSLAMGAVKVGERIHQNGQADVLNKILEGTALGQLQDPPTVG